MKIILSLLLFLSTFGSSFAALFGENSNNSQSSNKSISTQNIESEIEELKAQIAQKKRRLQNQKQKQETNKLRQELAQLKKLINQQSQKSNNNQGVPNIIINNSPVNTNTNTNNNSGGFSDIANKLLDSRKHRLAFGVSHFGEYITGIEGEEFEAPTISYSYIGDTFYLGGYHTLNMDHDFYINENCYYSCKRYSISYNKAYGIKAGLSLFKQGNLSINPYFAINKIEGDYNFKDYYYQYNSYNGGIDIEYNSFGVDAYIDFSKSFAIQLGADYVHKTEISASVGNISFSTSSIDGDSRFAKFFAGLAIKF